MDIKNIIICLHLPTKIDDSENLVFFIIDKPANDREEYWLKWWYGQRLNNGKIIKKDQIGDIVVEVRER